MKRGDNSDHQAIIGIAAKLEMTIERRVMQGPRPVAISAPSHTPTTPRPSAVQQAKTLSDKLNAAIKPVGKPDVSVIIPVFNKVDLTLNCIDSLAKQQTNYAFEVIVIDNASSDETPEMVSTIPGLRYFRNSENMGFVDACNQGAALAHGKIIVFLNNDTVTSDSWLQALVHRLESDASIGLVGSKLLYPDGSLQEAGGIIFSDGTGHNFGKHADPGDYRFNYVRDVDYCSGASIAISKALFNEIGGFDQRYAPAYYEDTDLAMSVRKVGKRVVYEPHSIVTHIEGATSGTDVNSGFKRYQAINHKKFVKKWGSTLGKLHHTPGTAINEASVSGKSKRLLIVDSIVPEPNHDAGSLRMTEMVKSAMSLGYAVSFFPENRVATLPYTADLQAMGVEVIYGNITPKDFYKERAGLYDAVILSRPLSALWHLGYCKSYQPQARVIYDTVDLHFLRISRQAEIEQSKTLHEEAESWQQIETYLMQNTDLTLVVSYEEQEMLKKLVPDVEVGIVSVINPVPVSEKPADYKDRSGILFIGSYNHLPNIDATRWFVKNALPLVTKKIGNVTYESLGSNPTAEVLSLAADNVRVPGFIDDVDPYFQQARVFICPLRFGAGVKGKISHALACGLPIVSTTIGAEGMHLRDGYNCLIADTPKEFADKVSKLYEDEKLWKSLQENALKTYRENFSPEAATRALKQALHAR
jgi:GT2 family glycosyltransferase/glycosyltransferase involved in cell wall biosynthesis